MKLLNKSGTILCEDSAEAMANLVVNTEYEPGDSIIVETSEQNIHVFAHVLSFEKKQILWIQMNQIIKADDPSPFPAITQLEVFGKVVK